MGNNSIKSSNKKFKKANKNKNHFCCLCTSNSFSIDEKYFPTFDRILSNNNHQISSKQTYYCQSIENLDKSHYNSVSIDSLSILDEQFTYILKQKSNHEFLNLIKKFQLNFYLNDYQNRLKNSNIKQTFKTHFSLSTIIYPCNGINQYLTDNLNLFITTPSESILPYLLINKNSSYKIHEQIRSICYFIPLNNCQIEPNDDEYKQKSIQLDRTHVVITLDNHKITDKISIEFQSSYIFTSNDSFQTGFICIDQEKINKEYLPFIYHCKEDNLFYLSSNLIEKWFNRLILVNQTCAIVKRFLIGDRTHFTCLLKEQNQLNKENLFSFDNNLIFAALRLPSCTTYLTDSSTINLEETKSEQILDAFSPIFLSDNKKISNDTIHIDYEQYSFAFLLYRWPKILIYNYYTHPNRYSKRRWPSKFHMNIIIKNSLLLIPNNNHQWKINFSLIEEYLFKLMNKSTLIFYILCQQLFSQTYSIRILIKHCFLNYCEKYGLPFSNKKNNILYLIKHFLNELSEQINKKFFPNYFNHQINLLNLNENYNQWFDYINKCIHNHIDYSSSSSLIIISNHSIIIEFLFDFINQLYEIFHIKRSEFYLNDKILLDLHKQLCENLLNNNSNLFLENFINNKQIIENIQMNLTYNFETNSELVHICLNQIRKAQTSLIFHYIWTIFIQYLHTYYNVLWNI